MKNKKVINVVVALICILLVLGVIVSYFLNKTIDIADQPVMESLNKQTEDTVKDYVNEKFNLAIEIPLQWKYEEKGTKTVFTSISNSGYFIELSNIYGKEARDKLILNDSSNIAKYYIFDGDKLTALELKKNTENITDQDKNLGLKIYEKMKMSLKPIKNINNECKPTGCSSQICSAENVMSTCEYIDYYACFKQTTCSKFSFGICGWEITDEFVKCLKDSSI